MKKDWIEVELGTVCGFIGGGTPSKSNPDYWVGEIPWASIKDLKGSFLFKTEDSISEEGLKNSASNLALVDDIILATRINPGRPIISKIKVAINQDLKIARPLLEFSPRFLFYLFKEIEPRVLKLSSGTTVLGINLTNLKSIVVPLPPLPEQRAIVARIEELFSELDHAVSSLQSAQAKLEIYRQAVLKKAFEGGFTNTDSIKWVELGSVCDNVEYGSSFKSEDSGLVPVLRMGNIQNGKFDWNDLKFSNSQDEINKYRLEKGDVLFNRTNSPEHVGKTAIFKGEREAIFAGYLIRINYKESLVVGDYLCYFLNSHTAKKFGDSVKSFGVNQSNINGTKLKKYPFPLTSIDEQTQIVQEIESRLSVADKLAETIQTNLQKSEALRQSILKKAFEGRLLCEAEVEACRREADWEPAERLLERIKSEKSKVKKS